MYKFFIFILLIVWICFTESISDSTKIKIDSIQIDSLINNAVNKAAIYFDKLININIIKPEVTK
jgi:hypothetical protein